MFATPPLSGLRIAVTHGARHPAAVRAPPVRGLVNQRVGSPARHSATASTRSLTPCVFTDTPSRRSASTLSPSATARCACCRRTGRAAASAVRRGWAAPRAQVGAELLIESRNAGRGQCRGCGGGHEVLQACGFRYGQVGSTMMPVSSKWPAIAPAVRPRRLRTPVAAVITSRTPRSRSRPRSCWSTQLLRRCPISSSSRTRSYFGLKIFLGKVRPLTSPRQGPSTGPDHCSRPANDCLHRALAHTVWTVALGT